MERWSSRFVVSRSCVHADGLLINSTSFVTVPLVLSSIYRGEWFLIFRIVPGIRKLLDFASERRVLAGDVVRAWNWLCGCRLRHGEHERFWLFKFSGLSVSWNTSRACFVNLFLFILWLRTTCTGGTYFGLWKDSDLRIVDYIEFFCDGFSVY